MKDIVDLIGRIFISFIFFFEAYDSAAYIHLTKKTMTEYHLTWNQDMLLYGAITALILGATLVLIGYRSALGAFLLLSYWLPVTFIVHAFWTEPAGPVLREQSIHFMKNLAIVGGLLIVLANGSGRYSVKRLLATTRVGRI